MLASFVCSAVHTALYPQTLDGSYDLNDLPVTAKILQVLAIVGTLTLLMTGTQYRAKIRARYQIPGSPFRDICTYLCCSCCAIAQEARHVDRDYGLMV